MIGLCSGRGSRNGQSVGYLTGTPPKDLHPTLWTWFLIVGFQNAHLIFLCPGTAPRPAALTASGRRGGGRRQEGEFLGAECSEPLTGVQSWGSYPSLVDVFPDLSHTCFQPLQKQTTGQCSNIYIFLFLLFHSTVPNHFKSFYSSQTVGGPNFMDV